MIKRLSKHNDLKDLIKSCPSGVIDDIYAIEYYIQGHNETIQGTFTKKETMLEVILPSSDLETLPNGILMRRAYYKVIDASYPDGYYNLEFEDNMNVWLGDSEVEPGPAPEPGEYVTEDELEETLADYATQDWVEDQGYYAPEMTYAPVEYHNLSEDSDIDIEDPQYDPKTMRLIEPGEDGFIIGDYLGTTDAGKDEINGFYFGRDQNGDPIAGKYKYYLYEKPAGVFTPTEDFSQFATENQLGIYATRTWVQQRGYATQTWATNQFLEESKVWTGTEAQWNQLTAEKKASYTIALITQ